ncbi:PE family protein, partial [Mycobacterium ulcerans]
MSYVVAIPDMLASAAADVAGIGSSVGAANTAAVGATTGVMAAADDEVSVAIAALFSGHGQAYQAISAQAAAFHDQFLRALTGAGGAGGFGNNTTGGIGGLGGAGGLFG